MDRKQYAAPKAKLINLGKTGTIKYEDSYGMIIPTCPFCHELAYESTYCVFCGASLTEPSKEEQDKAKELNGELTVTYENITLQQVAGACFAYQDGKLIYHSIGDNVSEEQLLERAKRLYERGKK